ncbi:MAG: hypothetical protein K0U63_02600 [Cyanobacteria bacterium]|nr:hypothetical protein [Cyanobacteriota bacterium]
MPERCAEIDDLAGRIFLAEHFCSRAIQAPEASEPAGEVRVWMELNDFDQAPIAQSAGMQVVLRSALVSVAPDCPVADVAMATPPEHWLDGTATMQQAFTALAQRDWLLVRSGSELLGILTRHDLASPVVSAYLLARLLVWSRACGGCMDPSATTRSLMNRGSLVSQVAGRWPRC